LQADWKVEIDEKIIEIRVKEKVRPFKNHWNSNQLKFESKKR
jgi:hypothetical protein